MFVLGKTVDLIKAKFEKMWVSDFKLGFCKLSRKLAAIRAISHHLCNSNKTKSFQKVVTYLTVSTQPTHRVKMLDIQKLLQFRERYSEGYRGQCPCVFTTSWSRAKIRLSDHLNMLFVSNGHRIEDHSMLALTDCRRISMVCTTTDPSTWRYAAPCGTSEELGYKRSDTRGARFAIGWLWVSLESRIPFRCKSPVVLASQLDC